MLSHSTWRDEKSVVRWRTEGEHHAVQEKGKFKIFQDYHPRVGDVFADTDGMPLIGHQGLFQTSVRTCQCLRPRRVVWALALSRPSVLPSVSGTTSAPRMRVLSRLNGWPMRSPVNASPMPSRASAHELGVDAVRSGRIEARTGLRMMPTFPRSPLSFRTAGFPRYGWKAGFSDGPFPASTRA